MGITASGGRVAAVAALGAATAALSAPAAGATVVQGSLDRLLGTPNTPDVRTVVVRGDRNALYAQAEHMHGQNVRIYRASQFWAGFTIANPSDARNLVTQFEANVVDDPTPKAVDGPITAQPGERIVAIGKSESAPSGSRPYYLYQCDMSLVIGTCK